jgi:ligand-binding sensor domain-containing protein
MRKIFFLNFLLLLNSCQQTENKTSAISEEQSAFPNSINTASDPTFVMPKDSATILGPQSITRSIMKDRSGTIWLGTWEGVLNYDGEVFTNVTIEKGWPKFHIFSILEAKRGSMWFGTIGGGAFRYDCSSNQFSNFNREDGLAGNDILCMMEDLSGHIWFGTKDGVCRYDGNFTTYTTKNGLASNFTSTIAQDERGVIWFGTEGGIFIYDATKIQSADARYFTEVLNSDGKSFHHLRCILKSRNGVMFIATQDGLFSYEPTAPDPKKIKSITTNYSGCIFQDSKERLWLSEGSAPAMMLSVSEPITAQGVQRLSFTSVETRNQIFGISEDKAGRIWFGTDKGAEVVGN